MVSTPPFVRGSPPISAGCAAWVSEPAAPSYSLLQNMDQQREVRSAETLRLAAMGYHFRKLNEAYSEPTL